MITSLYPRMTIVSKRSQYPGQSPESSILKTLAYFSIFQYPLLKTEIRKFLDQEITDAEFESALWQLQQAKALFRLNEFYSLKSDFLQAEKRIRGNQRAAQLLPRAMRIGRFLFRFPYVRAIGISGSLSKQFADERADIDFFIITKANRLWIARTIMHLFKKITFLTGRQHLYCMNYYVDENALRMEDKNIFIAMEVKTLLPVCGKKGLNDFFAANNWAEALLPGCDHPEPGNGKQPSSWIKQCIEWLANNRMGNGLDNFLMKITSHRWKRKEEKGRRNQKGYTMGLVTGKHFARSNPGSFQENILSAYREKIMELCARWPQWFGDQSSFL